MPVMLFQHVDEDIKEYNYGYYIFNETINHKHVIGTLLVIGGLL